MAKSIFSLSESLSTSKPPNPIITFCSRRNFTASSGVVNSISKLENGSDSLRLVTVGKVAKALGKRIEDFVVNEKR
ncbi:helix-turn-helix transcriptional regulator [Tissierella praeacuta]|uniref:hypothetical protein n=1 Tax=Tissierella praeacuta TaxID=43131 RepID=UPI0035124ED4